MVCTSRKHEDDLGKTRAALHPRRAHANMMRRMDVDSEVRDLLAAGEPARAATLVLEQLGPGTLRYLRSVLRDEADAADAFSVFAENLWRGLPAFRGESALRTWVYRVAWTAANNLRKEAWRRHGRRFETGEASRIAEDIRTRSVIRIERQSSALDELRRSLTVEEQSLLTLRLDQGLSWSEIAEVMASAGAPVRPDALMKRFERLKTRLGEMARAHGLLE